MAPHFANEALALLVQELLLERSQHYNRGELVAYLDGWTSALELLQKTDLVHPGASVQDKAAVNAFVERIRQAQYQVLDDENL